MMMDIYQCVRGCPHYVRENMLSSMDRLRVMCWVEKQIGNNVDAGVGGNGDPDAIFRMHSKCCSMYSEHMATAMGMASASENIEIARADADKFAMAAVKRYITGKKSMSMSTSQGGDENAVVSGAATVSGAAISTISTTDDEENEDDGMAIIMTGMNAYHASRISMKP